MNPLPHLRLIRRLRRVKLSYVHSSTTRFPSASWPCWRSSQMRKWRPLSARHVTSGSRFGAIRATTTPHATWCRPPVWLKPGRRPRTRRLSYAGLRAPTAPASRAWSKGLAGVDRVRDLTRPEAREELVEPASALGPARTADNAPRLWQSAAEYPSTMGPAEGS